MKHPLILSPRVDAKRHNPTTIMRKTNQACAQPPTKARHNAPRTCGSWDTHRKGVCGSPRPIHASDTRQPHARATARRTPREARTDVASLGSLRPVPPAEADPVGHGGGGGACLAAKARPEGKGFRSQSARQDFQRVAREGEGSVRGGRRARVRQHASYGWSYCCYCCQHHPRGDPQCKGLVRRQRATAKRGNTRRLTLPDTPS